MFGISNHDSREWVFPTQIFVIPTLTRKMTLECQLASNGITVAAPEGYQRRPESDVGKWRKRLEAVASVDSDEYADMIWGDAVEFTIGSANQTLQQDFDKVWLILMLNNACFFDGEPTVSGAGRELAGLSSCI